MLSKKLGAFKKMHKEITPQTLVLHGNCLSLNEYPVATDKNCQYYRAFCHDLYAGMGYNMPIFATESKEDGKATKKKYTIIEAYSRSKVQKKNGSKTK